MSRSMVLTLLAAAAVLAGLTGCGKGTAEPPPPEESAVVRKEEIVLLPALPAMGVGREVREAAVTAEPAETGQKDGMTEASASARNPKKAEPAKEEPSPALPEETAVPETEAKTEEEGELQGAERTYVICIDPGHGFIDGGSGDSEASFFPEGVLEKDITMPVALLLRDELEERGFDTIMTHNGEDWPEYDWDYNWIFNPNERVAMMNALYPDYIVSIHTNTAPNPDACGVQVYYNHISGSKWTSWDEPAAESIAAAIDEKIEVTAPTSLCNPINSENASLAVTRDTHAPAALIELGFCTNEADAENLNDPEWQAAVADAIAEGIARFFDGLEN